MIVSNDDVMIVIQQDQGNQLHLNRNDDCYLSLVHSIVVVVVVVVVMVVIIH